MILELDSIRYTEQCVHKYVQYINVLHAVVYSDVYSAAYGTVCFNGSSSYRLNTSSVRLIIDFFLIPLNSLRRLQ